METYNPNNPKYTPQSIGFTAIMHDIYKDGGTVRDM